MGKTDTVAGVVVVVAELLHLEPALGFCRHKGLVARKKSTQTAS